MESQVSDKSNQEDNCPTIECAKLHPKIEQALAELGMVQDVTTRPVCLTAKAMRGFLKGIDTAVEREPDRV